MGITPSRPHSFRSKESNTLFKVAWAFRKQDADVLHVSFKLNLLSYSLIYISFFFTVQDWQSILFFFEQTITSYWKKQVPQSSKG
jgi:hypothetical protein